jgi:NAD-dependent histone deacetylase SIR2
MAKKGSQKKEVSDVDMKKKHIETIASYLKKKDTKVAFFVGAGISTNCGIPDFRSPKTGLYSNLKRLNLPYPEAVFDIAYFRDKPKAFYTLAEELFPGKFIPSKFHFFIALCQKKGLLKRCYTQNIDTLERIAGVDDDKVLEAHGSFSGNHCIECEAEMSTEKLREFMDKKEIPTCAECSGYVKPDIVFFGEALPAKMWEYWEQDIDDVDLAIVAGTSLAVYPFASLPSEINGKARRVLINRELCGDFESQPRKTDVVLQCDCDEIVDLLCDQLEWTKELEELIEEGKAKITVEPKEHAETASEFVQELVKEVAPVLKKEAAEENAETSDDVDDLAAAVEKIAIKK